MPQSHCGYNWEGTLFSWWHIYYTHLFSKTLEHSVSWITYDHYRNIVSVIASHDQRVIQPTPNKHGRNWRNRATCLLSYKCFTANIYIKQQHQLPSNQIINILVLLKLHLRNNSETTQETSTIRSILTALNFLNTCENVKNNKMKNNA